jgi:hypothetical protein
MKEKDEYQQPVKSEPVKEDGEALKIQDETPHLQEYLTLKKRFDAANDLREGIQELFSKCKAWIGEQSDFASNDLKKAMVFALCEKLQATQQVILNEILTIDPIVRTMLEKIHSAEGAHGEANNGNPV